MANMQLRQGFPQMFPARMSAHHRDGAVQYAWVSESNSRKLIEHAGVPLVD